LEGGAVEHLAKPFSGKVLVAKVRAHVARRRSDKTLHDRLQFAETHAAVDALTGLYNRRHFEARLREEILHVRRHSRPLSVLLIDLDHFKSINDTFGHEDGDKVLKHVATTIRGVLRTEDTPCRYGGEEFVILLRESELEAAHFVGERLRTALQKAPIALGPQQESRVITFSGGIAGAHLGNQFDVDELVSRADQAMYRAKRAGRDRLVTE
ncbi:MAG TPA: diguanylate cyclase, partial [Polyangiaceae bacterium]